MSLITLFLASLLGSAHCVGMCGGFVICYSANAPQRVSPTIAYNLGRLVVYSLLGLIAGWFGQSVDLATSFVGVKNFTAVLIGFLLIAWGLAGLFGWGGLQTASTRWGRFINKLREIFASQIVSRLPDDWTRRALVIGLLSGLLPCGWLYAFIALAAASASPIYGALTMSVFWLGTVPYMVALAGFSHYLSLRLRRLIPKVTALLLVITGVFSATGQMGLDLLPFGSSHQHNHQHHHHQLHAEPM